MRPKIFFILSNIFCEGYRFLMKWFINIAWGNSTIARGNSNWLERTQQNLRQLPYDDIIRELTAISLRYDYMNTLWRELTYPWSNHFKWNPFISRKWFCTAQKHQRICSNPLQLFWNEVDFWENRLFSRTDVSLWVENKKLPPNSKIGQNSESFKVEYIRNHGKWVFLVIFITFFIWAHYGDPGSVRDFSVRCQMFAIWDE